jgi:ATP-dependent helicase/DNAse subunit B
MGLTLLAGPANAGKVALLLDRYLDALPRDPVLIVPNRSDVERNERRLLERCGALVGGTIGTFDDLFRDLGRASHAARPVATDEQRTLVLRRALSRASLNGLGPAARFPGFVDALGTAIGELEEGLLEPADLDGELASLYAAYRAELDAVGLWDRELERRYAAERVAGELDAWDGRPVFAYGFEDLTGAQWALVQALAGRGEVTVSLPYEPGRPVFASLARTSADLQGLTDGRVDELRADATARGPVLAYLERALFEDEAPAPPPLDGALRFVEGAGARATLELVAEEIVKLLRRGTDPESIAIVCPSLERASAALETALATLGVPFAPADSLPLHRTPFGAPLLALLRFAWRDGDRRDLYAFLRSPYSGLGRAHADYLEGRLRGRAILDGARAEEETRKLRGHLIPPLETLRTHESPREAVRTLAAGMLRATYGLESPPVGDAAKLDLRAHEAVVKLLDELEGWERLGGTLAQEDVYAALERVRVPRRLADDAGRVAILDLLRARTGRYEVVFVLGLEQGSLPRRASASPFLDDDARRELGDGARLVRPDPVARDRYLFYSACTRPTRRLYLVREAASDEGSPREASPFWDEVRALFPADEVERWTRRRPLSQLTWPLEQAPSERERLRAAAALVQQDADAATALARANGWERRLERARNAFERKTRLTHPTVLADLRGRTTFGVTELESFATCSSMWFVERLVDPRTIDPPVDAKLRGSIAHQALFKFFSGLPKELGAERVPRERLDDALAFLRRCLDEAFEGGVWLDLTPLQRSELREALARDLEQFVRAEAESELELVPRRFEVSFGSERSAPELQRGLQLDGFALTGKIDRIDVDAAMGARGIVQDYKSGKTAHSAAKIESELRLQIPLYMLVLRDLIGIEPLGGLYRALAGERQSRGLLRDEFAEDLPGLQRGDFKSEDEFWGQVERAKEHAIAFVRRVREGDVRHDPLGGPPCPTWCDLWPMCRVRRT